LNSESQIYHLQDWSHFVSPIDCEHLVLDGKQRIICKEKWQAELEISKAGISLVERALEAVRGIGWMKGSCTSSGPPGH
jgi:hypothetical protein